MWIELFAKNFQGNCFSVTCITAGWPLHFGPFCVALWPFWVVIERLRTASEWKHQRTLFHCILICLQTFCENFNPSSNWMDTFDHANLALPLLVRLPIRHADMLTCSPALRLGKVLGIRNLRRITLHYCPSIASRAKRTNCRQGKRYRKTLSELQHGQATQRKRPPVDRIENLSMDRRALPEAILVF